MKFSIKLSSRTIFAFIVIAYAIVLVPFVDTQQRNYLALFAALLGGISIVVYNIRVTSQIILAFLLLVLMSISALANDGTGTLLSVALTAVYICGYFSVSGILSQLRNKRALITKVLKNIIFAFAVVSVIQMLASLSGLPVPNVIGSKGIWSYPSLASEPSHLGRIVGITMLSYLILSRRDEPDNTAMRFFKNHRRVIIAFLTTMLLSGSALSLMAIAVVLIMWRSIFYAIIVLSLIVLATPFLSPLGGESFQRSFLFLSALPSLNVDLLVAADSSAAVRVVPSILFAQDASISNFSFWFGGGAAELERLVSGRIPGVPDDIIMAGFVPGYLAYYGLVNTMLFVWTFVLYPTNRHNAAISIFWLIFFTTSAWNTQVFWYGLMMIQVIKIALKESDQRPVGVGY
ncbi:hypothetical protein [Antarcticimicrobium sediminis]|uniref:O-antigen ligase like membrane protein n=1 Tax=Antarcticimicrobium sediminis TaxID=2546227 RepID=A0A4R5EGZ6_9RHOB|nr:hypothetical protein [Antarcticimicrobium sediminis]TDE33715.1 hypothetical protein E1B25_20985 [Antarcticimicrobium sediminis]